MMKILLLNPHLHEAPILATLQKLGVGVIVCSDFRECELVHKFHASSTTLFVGHDDDGLKMNELLKKNPRFATTPVILTTSKWSEKQCIEHQSSPLGANAYIRMPVEDKDFIHVIDEILGTELSHGKGFNTSDELSVLVPADDKTRIAPPLLSSDGGLILSGGHELQIEEAASVYGTATPGIEASDENTPKFNISLDEPSLHDGPAITVDLAGGNLGTRELEIDPGDGPSKLAQPIEAIGSDFLSDDISSVPVEKPTPAMEEEVDSDALHAMPYLARERGPSTVKYSNPLDYREPMDDAVVPGGAATAPDTETLKKYLYLREQDVTALSAQLRQARDQVTNLEGQLKQEKAISSEFAHLVQEQDRRINGFDKEKAVALETAQKEVDDLKFEMKRRSEKIRVMELQVKEATETTERLKERVRGDIRKIRSREKELENRLEIMKKDSEALLGAREVKIIELKRKLDLIEFNMDLLQDQLEKEKRTSHLVREKLAKAAQIVRVAGGLLSPEEEAILGTREASEAKQTSAA